jgi:hypothetical protein
MRRMRSRSFYGLGVVMFVSALVMVICAFAGTTGNFAVEGSLPIMNMILAAGLWVTGGLFYVGGAILTAAEQVAGGNTRFPESGAEADSAADRPREPGASSHDIKSA